jgi:hypothetical protein
MSLLNFGAVAAKVGKPTIPGEPAAAPAPGEEEVRGGDS